MRLLFLLTFFISSISHAQMYVMNVDFSGTSGTQMPLGWTNNVLNGDTGQDTWRFDNPGGRSVLFPMSAPFAMYDAGLNVGNLQRVALESRTFNAAGSNFILLMFDHTFDPGAGESAYLEVFDGEIWNPVTSWTLATNNPHPEVIDISNYAGGINTARIRFIFDGRGEGFWAIDNIRVYDARPNDAALIDISGPVLPFSDGPHLVHVDLANFGSQPLTTTTFHWEVDGLRQDDIPWAGNLTFGRIERGIPLQVIDFHGPVKLKVWHSMPNGQEDSNPFNDTIVRIIRPSLHGRYYIGGQGDDFDSFSDAINALQTSGVSGEVEFVVREGEYHDQFMLGAVHGSSEANRIVFMSENGNPDNTRVYFTEWLQTTARFRNTAFVSFRNIGFSGYQAVVIEENSHDIVFEGCLFEASDMAVLVRHGASGLEFAGNTFANSNVGIVLGDLQSNAVSDIALTTNRFRNIQQTAIQLNGGRQISISENMFIDVPAGIIARQAEGLRLIANRINQLSGFASQNFAINIQQSVQTSVVNNFIYTRGNASSTGMLIQDSQQTNILFNSVNVTNSNSASDSRGLHIRSGMGNIVKNNIFRNASQGYPIFLENALSGISIDYNNYIGPYDIIGRIQGDRYYVLDDWRQATAQDNSSITVDPFFTVDDQPHINQAQLAGGAEQITEVVEDIDGIIRPNPPAIGASEYIPCVIDAGINRIILPKRAIDPGLHSVLVELQNHGTSELTSVEIIWEVRGVQQPIVLITGISLAPGGFTTIDLGEYDFSGFFNVIRARTANPNGQGDDCNAFNDESIKSIVASGALCGGYTIGGADPDFVNFTDAVLALSTAGVSCPVTFIVRSGKYEEHIVLDELPDNISTHLIRFESESGNYNDVLWEFPFPGQAPLRLINARNVEFDGISFYGSSAVNISGQTEGIRFENCHFSVFTHPDIENRVIRIADNASGIQINRSIISGGYFGISINLAASPPESISIADNLFAGSLSSAIYFQGNGPARITRNRFEEIGRALLAQNPADLTFDANWLMLSTGSWTDHTGIDIREGRRIQMYNNAISWNGNSGATGIRLDNVQESGIFFNSISMNNHAPGAIIRGFWMLRGTSTQVLNNIFFVAGAGLPVHLEGTLTDQTLNYNNFFSNAGTIGRWNQMNYSGLNNWRNATSQDADSQSENPFFGPDLSINQALLDGKATPINWITTDIMSVTRDVNNPDPGAMEYTPVCAPDAGINRLISPDIVVSPDPDGNKLEVALQNHGTSALNQVRINVEITSGSVTDGFFYNWNGVLDAGGQLAVDIGAYPFMSGLYGVKIWTSLPDGEDDCNHLNDTIVVQLVSSLAGDYYIGGPGDDFADFSEAAAVLNVAGISDDVRFFVRDGTYSDRFAIGSIPGSTPGRSISFLPENIETGRVILAPETNNNPILIVRQASNIYFHQIEFRGNVAVVVEELSDSIHFEDCRFLVNRLGIQLNSGTSHVYFKRNYFAPANANVRPEYYIFLRWDTGGWNMHQRFEHIVIQDSEFNSPGIEAIHAFGVNHMLIAGNRFNDIRTGIKAIDVSNLEVHSNWLYINSAAGTNIGILAEDGAFAFIYNNFIHSRNSHAVTGIKLLRNQGNRIIFNTVNITNTNNDSRALCLEQSIISEIKNNVFNIKQQGYPIYITLPADGLDIDFNNYHSAFGLIGFLGSQVNSLSTWQNIVRGDANSSVSDPLFRNEDHPLPQQKDLNGGAIFIEDILLDINQTMRDENAPDMGCLEFYVDYGVTAMLAPGITCQLSGAETIRVGVTRFGEIPIDEIRLTVRINGGPRVENVISGFFDGYYEHEFDSTFDFSENGDYEIVLELYQILDDNLNNDMMIFTRHVRESPIVAVDMDYQCNHIVFNPVWMDGEEPGTLMQWDFGDGGQSDQWYPVHTYLNAGELDLTIHITTVNECTVEFLQTLDIEIPSAPLSVSATVTDQFCAGNSDASTLLSVSGGIPPYTVVFDGNITTVSATMLFDNLLPGEYAFEVIDSHQCIVTNTFAVLAAEPLDPAINFDLRTYYAPVSIDFSYTSNVNRVISGVFWRSGAEESTLPNPTFNFDEPGIYSVTLQLFSGIVETCMEETSITVEVGLREMSIDVQPIQRRCFVNPPARIQVPITGGTPPYLVTLFDESLNIIDLQELTQAYSTTFVDVPPGIYQIRVEDRFRQRIERTVTIDATVEMAPVIYGSADFGISPFEVEFWFEANINVSYVEWFYNGEIRNELRPKFRFIGEGEHLVYLTVYSGNPNDPGVCAEVAVPFVVLTEQQVVIQAPDIITPNGDGINDYFEVFQKNLMQIDVSIYDRRGVLVYAYDDLDGFWDGTYGNGKEAPDAMYLYHIKGVGFDDLMHTRTGMFQLVRETLNVFPNPASGIVNIDLRKNITHLVEVGVYDLRGNKAMLIRETPYAGLLQVDISGLQDGIYLLRVSDGVNVFNTRLHVLKR